VKEGGLKGSDGDKGRLRTRTAGKCRLLSASGLHTTLEQMQNVVKCNVM
jgi:hypothetical protein